VKKLIKIFASLVLMITTINAQVTDTIQVKSEWNLLSLPVKIGDTPISMIFPTAISDAFIYENEYINKDTVDNGIGFWLKFDSPDTFSITGEAIYKDTINVREGWNLIGTLTVPIHESFVTTEPEGIIISDYFYYDADYGYESSDTLKPGLGYWVRVDQDGKIILSSWLSCPDVPTVEYAGKTYNTVQIGTQCWLKENLDVGIMINGSLNQTENDTIEKYCYLDDPSYCVIYGGLYQWDEAMQYTDTPRTRGICPPGWHIPGSEEFQMLNYTVAGDGNALKAIGQGSEHGAGTDTSGFSALLAGFRSSGVGFNYLGETVFFWSSWQYDASRAYYMDLYYIHGSIYLIGYLHKWNGFSVRCLKD